MGPDDEKKLRQLMLMKRQLPQPNWDLLRRVTRRKSKAPVVSGQRITTATNVPQFLYNIKEDEAAKRNKKQQSGEEVEGGV